MSYVVKNPKDGVEMKNCNQSTRPEKIEQELDITEANQMYMNKNSSLSKEKRKTKTHIRTPLVKLLRLKRSPLDTRCESLTIDKDATRT